MKAELLYEGLLPLNADSCETLHLEKGAGQDERQACIVAVGMYQLDESTQRREGRIQLFDVGSSPGHPLEIREGVSWDLPGVFDAKWRVPRPSAPSSVDHILGVAAADGNLKLYGIQRNSSFAFDSSPAPSVSRTPEIICEVSPPSGGAMALVLEWSRGAAADRVCCSYSTGDLAVYRLREGGGLSSEVAWSAHSLEAWSCAFHPLTDPESAAEGGYLVWSGGDDCAFHLWDLRQGTDQAAISLRKAHTAGVCCIAPSIHTGEEHVLFTGSYDEHVRMWDLRTVGDTPNGVPPKVLAKEPTGGGVWRLRHQQGAAGQLFAACMYNGYATLDYSAAEGTLAIGSAFDQTGALCYGTDFVSADAAPETLVATASFYDKRFSLWKLS